MIKLLLALAVGAIPVLATAQVPNDQTQRRKQNTFPHYNNEPDKDGRQRTYMTNPGGVQTNCYQTGNGDVICK